MAEEMEVDSKEHFYSARVEKVFKDIDDKINSVSVDKKLTPNSPSL